MKFQRLYNKCVDFALHLNEIPSMSMSLNKFYSFLAKLLKNKPLWLVKRSHMN